MFFRVLVLFGVKRFGDWCCGFLPCLMIDWMSIPSIFHSCLRVDSTGLVAR